MSEHETFTLPEGEFSFGWIDKRVIIGASVVGILVNLNALLVPLLGTIAGGTVAGFIAGYASGRIVSGLVHAVIASGITGVVAALIASSLGVTMGLYNEPPLLVFESVGPISPMVIGLGLPSLILFVSILTLLTVVDGLVGGVIGVGLRSILPW